MFIPQKRFAILFSFSHEHSVLNRFFRVVNLLIVITATLVIVESVNCNHGYTRLVVESAVFCCFLLLPCYREKNTICSTYLSVLVILLKVIISVEIKKIHTVISNSTLVFAIHFTQVKCICSFFIKCNLN